MGALHRAIYSMSLKSPSNSPVLIIRKIMLFFQIGDLYGHFHFNAVDRFAEPLFVGKSFINRFFKVPFRIELRNVPILSCRVAHIWKCRVSSEPLQVLQAALDIKGDTKRDPDSHIRTTPLRISKVSQFCKTQSVCTTSH